MPVVTDYTALLSGSYWNGIEVTGKPVIVTYSFPTSAPAYISGVEGFTGSTVASFQAFTPAQQTQVRTALTEWATASGIVFIEVAPGAGDLNFQGVNFNTTSGPSYAGAGGIAFYPFGNWDFLSYPYFNDDLDASGDVFMNTQFLSGGLYTYGTILHEIGHALGLKHPLEIVTNFAADPDAVHDQVLSADDPNLTIMATVGGSTEALKQLDKNAVAFIYGASGGSVVTADASGSNSVSSWSWVSATQTLTQTGAGGNDTIRGSSVRDVINGAGGNDRLFGLAGNDTLNGGTGDDHLFGGSGIDSLAGGDGNDTYYVDATADKITEAAVVGYDFVYASASFTLSANLEGLQLFGNSLTATGNSGANAIFGDGFYKSTLKGVGGDDYMVAGSNNDILDGGTGNDTMYGGQGNDTYYVNSALDAPHELAGEGTLDKLYASANYTLTDNEYIEYLYVNSATGISLSGNNLANRLYGNVQNDTLGGAGGDDILDGKAGADEMSGGNGNDTYYVDNVNDRVLETSTGGTIDRVYSRVNYTLTAGQYVEALYASGATAGMNLSGNELTNQVYGSVFGDTLSGGGGIDRLTGYAGNDTLLGGDGVDTIYGGANNDRIVGGAGIDSLFGEAGSDTFVLTPGAVDYDNIRDFVSGADKLEISASLFGGGLSAGGLTGLQFIANGSGLATDGGSDKTRFIYNLSNGQLFYDADGTGAGARVRIANLIGTPAPALAIGDFGIIA